MEGGEWEDVDEVMRYKSQEKKSEEIGRTR